MITEKILIEQCALTLSKLKTASLFTVKYEDECSLLENIYYWNKAFMDKGIKLIAIKSKKNRCLVYVYREEMLARDLENKKAKKIMSIYGYDLKSIDETIERLKFRLEKYDEFPHEIGLFLGYPPEDVEGFICNKGQNCNLCRYWKVYGDHEQALIKFARFDKCKQIYQKLWSEGENILKLTVA